MKIKISLVLITLISSLICMPLARANADESVNLRINEIMYNPSATQGDDADCEWIELYNPTEVSINLKGWSLEGIIFDDLFLETKEYAIFARELIDGSDLDTYSFEAFWGNNNGIWGDSEIENFKAYQFSLNLTNTQDSVVLVSPDTTYQDLITYESSWGANGNGRTLERNPEKLAEWHESYTDSGTPGKINNRAPSIPTNLSATSDFIPKLSWLNSIDPDEGQGIHYLLEISTDGIIFNLVENNLIDTNYTPNLEAGNYYFHVAASDGVLQSDFSENKNFTISGPDLPKTIWITELFPDPASPLTDANDEAIELYNYGDQAVSLKNWKIKDTVGGTISEFIFAEINLEPKQYLVLKSSDSGIALNNDGDSVQIFDPNGNLISDTPNYGTAREGKSFARKDDGSWAWTNPTLGSANSFEITGAVLSTSTTKASTAKTSVYPTGGADFNEYVFTPVVLGGDWRDKTLIASLAVEPKNLAFSQTPNSKIPYIFWYIMLLSSAGIIFILFYPWRREESILDLME